MKHLYQTLLLALIPNVIAVSSPPIVDLGYAQYQGVRNNDTSNIDFLGVRYAKSPTGSLRWKAPQSPDSVPGIQLANSQPPMCFQAPSGTAPESLLGNSSSKKRDVDEGLLPADEDCLFLNVYVPGSQFKNATASDNDTDSDGLPVLVWIHGGGYHSGSAGSTGFPNTTGSYDGEDLLQISNDRTIVVVVQYRLGLFGFLAGETIKNDGDLNAGLLDQQFALQWIQQHISKFGGDPNRVVIWGESAGAGSVLNHIIANNGQTDPPLFIGGISSSMYLPPCYPYNDDFPEAIYSKVVDQTNCTNSQDTLSCLRSTDIASLSAANVQIAASAGFFGTFTFGPVVDGSFIAQRPSELLAEGHLNKVQKVLAITNTFEGVIFTDPNVTNLTEYVKSLYPTLSEDTVTSVVETYSGSNSTGAADTSVFDIAAQIRSESTFICPTYYLLDAFQGRSYKGLFAIPPALHGDDIFYYFSSLDRPSPPVYNNTDFDKAFSQSFLAFATSEELDPNNKIEENILPEWPLWNGSAVNNMPQEMLFNRTEDFKPMIEVFGTDEELLRRCGFWRSITAQTSQ